VRAPEALQFLGQMQSLGPVQPLGEEPRSRIIGQAGRTASPLTAGLLADRQDLAERRIHRAAIAWCIASGLMPLDEQRIPAVAPGIRCCQLLMDRNPAHRPWGLGDSL